MTDQRDGQTFVLLEMMNHMLLVAEEAKRRGFRVVVLNQNPLQTEGPFAVPDGLVDELVTVGAWGDEDALRVLLDDLLERHTVAGTYAAFEGALRYEAELRERSGLPTGGAAAVTGALDKGLVRRKLFEEGLSTLRSTSLTEALTWEEWQFSGSAVVKPANGTGSALCFTVSTLEELAEAAERIAAAEVVNALMKDYILAHGEFVVEERAQGELLSAESLVVRGEVHHVGLTGRYVSALDHVVELGAVFPYAHPREEEITARVAEFHRCLGITHGPTHVEVMVPDEGPIELIDFNVRTIGAGMAVCVGNAYEIPYAVPLTDVACGEDVDLSFLKREPRCSADMLLLPPPGSTRMKDLEFPENSAYGRLTKKVGAPLSGRTDQLDVVGMVVVTADTPEELHHKAMEVRRETLFGGAPLGDNPNNRLVCPRYISNSTQREAVS